MRTSVLDTLESWPSRSLLLVPGGPRRRSSGFRGSLKWRAFPRACRPSRRQRPPRPGHARRSRPSGRCPPLHRRSRMPSRRSRRSLEQDLCPERWPSARWRSPSCPRPLPRSLRQRRRTWLRRPQLRRPPPRPRLHRRQRWERAAPRHRQPHPHPGPRHLGTGPHPRLALPIRMCPLTPAIRVRPIRPLARPLLTLRPSLRGRSNRAP
jgi:hypothetical protein